MKTKSKKEQVIYILWKDEEEENKTDISYNEIQNPGVY